jgi:type I restriction enzyme S subunit
MSNYVQLREITSKIGAGATPTGGKNAYHSQGISFIRSQNVHDFKFSLDGLAFIDEKQAKELNNVTVEENDILLNITGDSIARVCVVPNKILPARVNQHVAIIRCISNVDCHYVFYYLENLKPYLLKICGVGGTRNALTKEAIEKLEIHLPEISTQQKIASVLSALDSKIELNNRINAELEAMAKTLYDYWFVQFDFPDKNGKPYKTSGGKMVWNEELKREIPEGWEVKKINSIIEVKDGTHDSPKPKSVGYRLITSKNLQVSGLDFDNANLISEEDYLSIIKRSNVETGDILFSMIGNIGTIYKIEEKEINFAIKNVALYKTSQKEEYKNYIYMFLKSVDMDRYMKNVISGSIQKFIGLNSLRETPILSNEVFIKKYNEITYSIFEKLENLKLENQKLTELRDWLLPMLMNGQVKVSEL